jgi:hypothetical protein
MSIGSPRGWDEQFNHRNTPARAPVFGSLGIAMIRYTDYADFTDSHGKRLNLLYRTNGTNGKNAAKAPRTPRKPSNLGEPGVLGGKKRKVYGRE